METFGPSALVEQGSSGAAGVAAAAPVTLAPDAKVRRDLVFQLGSWDEPFAGSSLIFGDAPGTVHARCYWRRLGEGEIGEEEGGSEVVWAHCTTRKTPFGKETTTRFSGRRRRQRQRRSSAIATSCRLVATTQRRFLAGKCLSGYLMWAGLSSK